MQALFRLRNNLRSVVVTLVASSSFFKYFDVAAERLWVIDTVKPEVLAQ